MVTRKKKDEEETGVVADVQSEESEEGAGTTSTPAKELKYSITVKFRDHRGEPTERTFSKEVHGDDYEKLAEQFSAKHASRLIKG